MVRGAAAGDRCLHHNEGRSRRECRKSGNRACVARPRSRCALRVATAPAKSRQAVARDPSTEVLKESGLFTGHRRRQAAASAGGATHSVIGREVRCVFAWSPRVRVRSAVGSVRTDVKGLSPRLGPRSGCRRRRCRRRTLERSRLSQSMQTARCHPRSGEHSAHPPPHRPPHRTTGGRAARPPPGARLPRGRADGAGLRCIAPLPNCRASAWTEASCPPRSQTGNPASNTTIRCRRQHQLPRSNCRVCHRTPESPFGVLMSPPPRPRSHRARSAPAAPARRVVRDLARRRAAALLEHASK